MFKISSKVKYSSLILLLAVVVMFYSTALPFSAAVEPTIEYVPITLGIEEIAYFSDQFSDLSYYTGVLNNSSFVLYTNKMSIVQENQTLGFGKPRLFEYGYLDNVDNIVYFFPPNFNTAFTIDTGDSIFFEACLYLPFEYFIGPETKFEVGTYFQSRISSSAGQWVDLEVYLMYSSTEPVGMRVSGSSNITYNAMPLVDDFLSRHFLVDILPTDVYNYAEICRYDATFTPNLNFHNTEYLGRPDGVDELFLTFYFNFDLFDFELNSEIFFPCLYLKPFTVYVREEIAPTVEEYLTAITNPSPESKAEVERLEQELQDISEQLREDASDLEVEKPDISDSVEDLPSEVVDGMDEVGQTVLSPLMNLELIATLFSVLFGVVALKLILFGSGTS